MNVISTEVRVKPERSGEIPRGSLPLTILLYSFRPYLSAQPTVGRFVLGPPTGNPCGQVYKAYLSAKIVFAPARRGARAGEFWGYTAPIRSYSLPRALSTSSLDDGARSVSLGWRADEGVRPYHVLPKVSTDIADLPAGTPYHR